MPIIFKDIKNDWDVEESDMADFVKDHPNAYAIMEDTAGKKWKVRASKYFKFQADQMHLDPANPFSTSTIEDSPYKDEEQQATHEAPLTLGGEIKDTGTELISPYMAEMKARKELTGNYFPQAQVPTPTRGGSQSSMLNPGYTPTDAIAEAGERASNTIRAEKYKEIMSPYVSTYEKEEKRQALNKQYEDGTLGGSSAAGRANAYKQLQQLNEEAKPWVEADNKEWTPESADEFRQQVIAETHRDPYAIVPESFKAQVAKQFGKEQSEEKYLAEWLNQKSAGRKAFLHGELVKSLLEPSKEDAERLAGIKERAEANSVGFMDKIKANYNAFGRLGNRVGTIPVVMSILQEGLDINKQTARALDKAEEIKQAYVNHSNDENFFIGVGKGIKDGLTDVDNWTGVYMAGDMGILTNLVGKINRGEKLTQEEEDYMDAQAYKLAVEAAMADELGWGYKSGNVTGVSIPFMLQMIASPVSGSTGMAVNKTLMGLGKRAVNKFGGTILKNLLAKTPKGITKILGSTAAQNIGKGLSRIAGATTAGAMQTAIFHADRTVADAMDRNLGNQAVVERTNEQYGTSLIPTFGEDMLTSTAKAVISGTSMNATEYLGGLLINPLITRYGKNLTQPLKETLAVFKPESVLRAAKTTGAGKAIQEMENLGNYLKGSSKFVDRLARSAEYDGLVSEYLEEVVDNVVNTAIGDMSVEDLLSPKKNAETILGLSWTAGAFNVMNKTARTTHYISLSRKMKKADLSLQEALKNKPEILSKYEQFKQQLGQLRSFDEVGQAFGEFVDELATQGSDATVANLIADATRYTSAYAGKMGHEAVIMTENKSDIASLVADSRENGYSMMDAYARKNIKAQLDKLSSIYGEAIEEKIAEAGGEVEFLRSIEGQVSDETFGTVLDYILLKEQYEGIKDARADELDAKVEVMNKRVDRSTHRESGMLIGAQMTDEQGGIITDPTTNEPKIFFVVSGDLTVDGGAVTPGVGTTIVRDLSGKYQMVDMSRLSGFMAEDANARKIYEAAVIASQEREKVEEEENLEEPSVAPTSAPPPTPTSSVAPSTPTATEGASSVPALEVVIEELARFGETGQEAMQLVDGLIESGESEEVINSQIETNFGSVAPQVKAYYMAKASALAEAVVEEAVAEEEQVHQGATPATEAPAVPTPHVIRNKDNDLDVDAMIANGVTPEQMAEDLTAEFSSVDPGLALSTAQEYLAQVQEERAKTKSIIAKNGSLRKKEQFWSNVVGILTPQQESIPVAETEPVTETPQAEVPAEAQNANAKWQAAPKVYGRETTLRVKGMRLRGRYVVAPAGVVTGSHTADFEDNPDFIHDEQGRSRNPRDYSQASNQATTQEIAGNFALQNMQIVSPEGIVYDGNGRQIAGDIAAQNGTDGAYLEDLMDRADEFGFTPEQIQGMEHPRVYFEVAPGQLDYSAQTFDKFNAPEMKAPSAVELGAAMGQVLSDETFNRLADTIKQSGGLSAVYKSKPLQEAIAYILRDASDVKDVTTATLPQYYNADTRTLTEAGRNLLEACLLGKIFADNPQVLALLPKLPNKVMSKVAQAMPELAANMQMGEYALKDELANALTLVYEASQSGTSVNDYATQQDWTKGGSATDIFGKTVVMLAKALNGEIEGAELADVVRAYNVKAVDVVTGQGSIFEPPTREQMLQEVINYYMRGEVATQGEEVATEESVPQQEEAAPVTEESAPQQEEVVAQPKTREEKVNAMSDEEFNALLASNDLEAMRAYEQELHAMLGIDEAEGEEYNKRSAKLAAIKAEFGEFDNAPASVRNEYLKMSGEIEQKYSPTKVNERLDAMRTRIFEVEAQRAREEEQREKEEKENYRKTAHNGFLAEKTPMGAAKADKALNKQYRVDGKVNTVAGFIEAWNEEGSIKTDSWKDGSKTTYIVNGHDFGKTAYDYAQYLQNKKQQETVAGETAPTEQKAESVSHEELVEQNKQKLSSHANRDLNVLIKKIKDAMPHLQARVERTEEGSEERQEAEEELKEWSAVLEAAETLLAEHKKGSWKNQFVVPLSESKELSIEEVKALFESLNGDKAVGELFDKVYAVAKTLGLKIKISDQLSTAQGNAGNDGIVKYAASLFYLPHSAQERASTLLHELIHTCTMYATGLHANRNNSRGLTSLYDGLPQQIKDACAELEEIYNNIKNDKRVAGEYGIKSVDEMVAELSNPVFREKMKEISLWGKIVGAIKRLFGFEALAPEGSEVSNALAEAERVLVKMLDNFDKSTYDAIKDKLQQSGRGRRNAVLGERLNAYFGKRDKPYGADNPYRNKDKATFEEREEIIRIVKKNKYDKVGTDIIRVGDTLFLIDHTDAEDLLNLYNNGIIPDGQGYGIRKKYNFASINKEDINEITRNIAESYNYNAESVRNWLQELGFKSGDLLELDIAIELARGNRNNGVGIGASGRSGREVDADRSSSTSGKDKGEVLGETEEEGILYRTSDEIEAEYPNWLEGTTTDSGKHSTQVEGTRKTYNKVGNWIENNLGKDVAILDASSGMGYGTADLRERGFNIEDVEPYQSEERKQNNPATYDSYDAIDKEYDFIISNAVLNVIPDDWRAGVLHSMASKLREGGKMFINTRKAGEEKSIKDKIELDSPQEVLVKRNGKIASYQKFFTPSELKAWVESELGEGYTVEIANEKNSGTKGLAAVVVTKNSGADAYRQGDGRYTDEELALINDPAARLYGESFRTKKQQKEYAERVRNHMRKKANELSEKLHLPVEIIESEEDMAKLQGKKAKAKGWYEVKSGKIVLVLPNNESVADIVETVLHEGVAHLGLRKLFGKQFTQFLDNVYNHAEQSIREKIDEIARKGKVSTRTATEEYLASLAETTDFENTNAKWWQQIKKFFLDMLHTIGFDYKGGTISDSELRYILWRSHENLKDGRYADVFSVAKDIALQNRLKAEEKLAKERRRILSLGKTDSNPLVADRVNEEGLVYNLKKGIRISPQEYAQVSAIIQTYPNKSERGHVFTANNYYLCTDIDEEGNFRVVAAMPIEGNEELINEIRGENKYIAFKPLSRTESTAGVISRLQRQRKRIGGNLSATEGQAGVDGRDDSVHLGQQANTGADQRSSDRNDGAVEEETLYRMGDANNPNETAQRVYNEEMLSARFLARETMVDYLAALDSLQRIIAEKGGKITSFQDAYSRMLALSSRNKQEIDLFDYSVMPELTKAIGEILGRTGKINWESPEAKTLQRYTKVKHGIERDRDMAVRKALPAIADMKFKEQFAEINQRIEASTLRSEYEALIKERADMRANPAKYGLLSAEQIEGSLEAEWYKRTGEIRAKEGTWKEKQQKMDRAIAEVFGLDQVGLNAFGLDLTEDYSGITETLVNEGLLTRKEVRKDRYAARKKAYEFVEQYEEQIGQGKADGLWNAIKAVSGFALEKQRQCGLVSAKYVADCNKRFEFYVPLRGFNEDVAHDVYDYLDDAYNNNNPVQTAKGRESEAGNPFANLMNIGYRSITAGNHNLAVQAFWNLANRKDVKGFLVPSRVWHLAELTPEQQHTVSELLRGVAVINNDEILPYLPEDATAEEIQDILDAFEEYTKKLKARGYIYQGSRKAKQELRTLSKAEENAHRVKVYINGEVRYVTVVGNPRAAQALNGQLNPEQADWAALKGLQNFLAGAFTSQNPSFALANLVRDTQHANMRAFITENPKYWGTLTKKQAKLWRLGTIMKMLAAYENSIGNTGRHEWRGTLDPTDETHMRFKRFMEQGGATGFTFSRKQHENLEKLAKMAENVEGKSTPGQGFVVGEFFDAIRTFSEASELVNRFAAYETSLEMGRTEQQAIRDAKEITLNFNRKGAGRATYNASRASGNKAYTNIKYSAVNGLANLSQFGRDNLIFWNASVQGAYQLWSMLKKHPVKTFIVYGAVPYTLAAFGLPILNALLCGGDDDKYYDELPEYERQRNICIKIPGTKGWFKIPLDPATQKIWAMGEATGAVMRGKKQFNLWNDIGANIVGLFSPVDIYWGDKNQNIVQRALSVGSSFTPTLAQPLLHTFANRDWKGKPLENNSRYLDHLPSYKKAFKSDKTSLTELSKWMNEWANEDADTYKVGPFDFASPGVMEELLFGYTGGYGQAALAVVEAAWSLVSDEARGKFQLDKQPIINRFWVEGDPGQTKRSIFMNYNREVGDFMEEVEQRRSALNRDIKNAAIKQDDTDYGEAVDAREKFFNSTDWKKYVKLKAADAQVRQEAKGGIENASDITTSAMLEAIEMIHDDKAFEADEQ